MPRLLPTQARLPLLALLLATGCAPVCNNERIRLPVTIDVGGEEPVFSWPGEGINGLDVIDETGNLVWLIGCEDELLEAPSGFGMHENCITSPVVYGDDQGTALPAEQAPEALTRGTSYEVTVHRTVVDEDACWRWDFDFEEFEF